MPLDTRIPLMSQAAPVNLAPGMNALLGIQNMRQQQERAPIQNRLLETQIAGAKQTQAGNDRELQLKAAQFQNQAFRALKSIPDPALRKMAYASFVEHGKQIGIHDGVPDDDISDQGLDAGIAATQGFMPEQTDYRGQEIQLRRDQMAQSRTQFDKEMTLREKQLAAQQAGSYDTPAAQREAEWYMSLPPDKKAEVDRYRRGDRVAVGTEDKIYKTAVAAEEARQRAVNYDDLASRYEQSDIGSGMFGSSLPEAVKELTGSQDGYTAMRKDWAGIKASQVVSNLPPGAASDADVKLALGGFLPDNANPKQVASFMRGIAKLERIKGDYESFKSDYMSENKSPVGLNQAWKVYAKQQGIGGPTINSANQQPAPAQQQGSGATNAKGWTLHQDAQGNKAYVGPNGEIEEVQ